jgi:hypothetical protein
LLVVPGCDSILGLHVVPGLADGGTGDACARGCDALTAAARRLVISEISVAGLDPTCSHNDVDELVEIYNPGPDAVDLTGLVLECSLSTSAGFQKCAELDGTIAAHGYYLTSGVGALGSSCGYLNPTPDLILTGTLTDDAGAARLVGPDREVIDAVAWGARGGGEGAAITPWPAASWSPEFNAIERKATAGSTADSMTFGGAEQGAGNGYDSGDNKADFVFRAGRDPQNTKSTTEPK